LPTSPEGPVGGGAAGGTKVPPDSGPDPTQTGSKPGSQTGGQALRIEPQAILRSVITEVVKGVGTAVKAEAATAVAQTFGFPLALMFAVLIFLLIQSRMDERDPKLRRAPLTDAETIVPFVNESEL
jgi:hypothetical protein